MEYHPFVFGPRVVAIVPAYNEEQAIIQTLEELRSCHPEIDILVVDDGSTDRTNSLVRSQNVHLIRLPFNLGIGAALRTGFLWASNKGYNAAIQFDADGQHDPREVQSLLSRLSSGADIVIGSRFLESHSEGLHLTVFRRLAMRLLSLLIAGVSGLRIHDTSSGFRAFNKSVIDYFAMHYPQDYLESSESIVMAAAAGFKIVEHPTRMRSRRGGSPSHGSVMASLQLIRVMFSLVVRAQARSNTKP